MKSGGRPRMLQIAFYLQKRYSVAEHSRTRMEEADLFDTMPDETLLHILSFLVSGGQTRKEKENAVIDTLMFGLTCRRLWALCQENDVWHTACSAWDLCYLPPSHFSLTTEEVPLTYQELFWRHNSRGAHFRLNLNAEDEDVSPLFSWQAKTKEDYSETVYLRFGETYVYEFCPAW